MACLRIMVIFAVLGHNMETGAHCLRERLHAF
jgi:hypothetical protein